MNQEEYLSKDIVIDFVNWLIPRISGDIEFNHLYYSKKYKSNWKCTSIFNAYENYIWDFRTFMPKTGHIKGKTFAESEELLKKIQIGLYDAIQSKDELSLIKYIYSVLKWGGVSNSNCNKIMEIEDNLIDYFNRIIKKLNPLTVNTNDDFNSIIMNSGFTKIYSLLINDFVIYDSRVGAALGLLARNFLEESGIYFVPEELNFAFGNSRSGKKPNERDPSSEIHKFTALNNTNKKHIKNNIYANWLLKKVSEESKFKYENNPIRTLEAALFMIGYSVRQN